MIRVSEVVLPGHPDKLCDQIADEIIAECVKVDADAYRQVEVAVWSDQVWLSGGVCTRRPVEVRFDEVGRRVGRRIGLTAGSWIDADRYEVKDTVCREIGDPRRWTSSVNDQAIVIGWAGYDARIRYISPEHFLAHACREALFASFQGGLLDRHGPDGKLLLRLREDSEGWTLEHLLVTIQHPREASILEVCRGVARVAEEAYARVRATHPRWLAPWDEVETIINPNGPLLNGGSDGDNGQTGRKLVADYFGPRVPIGGGALSGKHLTHVDRTGAYAARETAVRAVQGGAGECLVRVSYAPGLSAPLDVSYELTGLGPRQPAAWFGHEAMQTRYPTALDYAALARGGGDTSSTWRSLGTWRAISQQTGRLDSRGSLVEGNVSLAAAGAQIRSGRAFVDKAILRRGYVRQAILAPSCLVPAAPSWTLPVPRNPLGRLA